MFFTIIPYIFSYLLDGQPPRFPHQHPESRSLIESNSSLHDDYAEIVDETEGDYSSPSRDFELDRDCVHLSEILGQGQFGDVYGGLYSHANGTDIPVAVKTCKLEAEEGTAEKILEEARNYTFLFIFFFKYCCSDMDRVLPETRVFRF